MLSTAVLLIAAVSQLCWSPGHSLRIDKATGAYEDIVVAIHPSVEPDERIVENIKALFRSASTFLQRATRGLVHFGSVTIAVPDTWPPRPGAVTTAASLFPTADVRVAAENPQYGDTPYTLQPRGCGERGEYIHLTPRFMTDMNGSIAETYGSPAYQLVHEWAHYRYGVFDEYGDPESFRYPSLYCEFGMVRASACSENIRFTASTDSGEPCRIYKGCRVSSRCQPKFSQSDKNPVTSSIMFMPYLKDVTEFCDNAERKHNIFAPNKHNHLCGRKSTWEVISANEDFKQLPRADLGRAIRVKFTEVQKTKGALGRVIFALDISGSMNSQNRIGYLREAAGNFITVLIPDGLEAGIVTFSTGVDSVSPLTPMQTSVRKQYAGEVAQLTTSGMTCIGCALRKALEMFKENKQSTEGSVIILMTDGEENQSPRIADVVDELIAARVVVNTIAFGTSAEQTLEDLARRTGGKPFALRDGQSNVAVALESAFLDSTTALLDDDKRPVVVFEQSVRVVQKQEFQIVVDADVGNETVVSVLSDDAANLNAELRYPDGKDCQDCLESGPATSGKYITFKIPGIATPGTWTLIVSHKLSNREAVVHIRATSLASGATEEAVLVRAFLKKTEVAKAAEAVIYAEVTKGQKVVLHARVTATVIKPKPPYEVEVELFDDGLGADVTANDGIYSGYFTQFDGVGRYSVSARVVSGNDSVIVRGRKASGGLPAPHSLGPASSAAPAQTEDFQGIPLDKFVYVDHDIEHAEPNIVPSEKAPQFVRHAEGGSFRLTQDIKTSTIPPGSIQDLKVEDAFVADNGTHIVVLVWTCPGAHLNSGNASRIELRVSPQLEGLMKDFDSAVEITPEEGNISAASVGSRQRLQFALHEELLGADNKSSVHDFYFAARVWNEQRLHSAVSNIARVTFERPPPLMASSGGVLAAWAIAVIVVAVVVVLALIIGASVSVYSKHRTRKDVISGSGVHRSKNTHL
ncbi:calcium-activated chloride channel regulator 1-like isoform X2 [Amblyomma americanum]